MIIVMLGAPGSGRHTQGNMLAKHWGIPHISLRDLIHDEIKQETELGQKLGPMIKKGEVVPNDMIYQLFNQRLGTFDFRQGIVFNGFPVTPKQLKDLNKSLKNIGQKIDYALLMEVPEGESIRRLGGRRVCNDCNLEYHIAYKPPRTDGICDGCKEDLLFLMDDHPEVARKRIQWFREVSPPLLEVYEKMGVLHPVNGVESVEAIHRGISDQLGFAAWAEERKSS